MIGQTVSHFKVLEKLGEGGMGVVYKAQDLRLDRLVALKFLPHHLARNDAEKARFLQEAKAASALNHPHVCTIYGIDEHEGMEFIEMEYVDGVTLRQKVAPDGALPALLPLGDIISYATQIGEALQEAHGKGIVHRDIKADNIMINASKQIKVMDFGLAKLKGSLKLTRTSSTVGTLAYMAPEQIQGGEADARSDIFSFGVVLYEMLSGRTPFRGEHEAAMMYSILNEDPEPAQKYRPELSPEFLHILSRSLEKNPDERYQSMQEMLIDLRRLKRESTKVRRTSMADMPIPSAAEIESSRIAPSAHAPAGGRRPGAAMIGAGVVAVLALALAAWYLLSGTGERHESFQSMKITRMTTIGTAGYATISPDGKYIVHSRIKDGKTGLWVRQVATSSNVEIVSPSDANYIGTTFSHDGNFVYYVISNESYPDGVLYRIPVLGGESKRILANLATPITLSPDGLRCAFVRRRNPRPNEETLVSAALDGSEERTLVSRIGEDFFMAGSNGPSWSSDGKLIAASIGTTKGGFHTAVAVFAADDGGQKFLSSRTWNIAARVAWLHDGSGLILSALDTVGANYQIWNISYPNGDTRRITNDVTNYGDVSLGLTANDSMLVSVQQDAVSHIWTGPLGDAAKSRKVTSGTSSYTGVSGLSWTPDGTKIVYFSMIGGNGHLWIMDRDGNNQRQLTSAPRDDSAPFVTADGRSILFCSSRSGTSNVWKMDLDGSNPVRLTTTEDYVAQCTPDGRWLIYHGFGLGYGSIWKKPMSGGDAVPLTTKVSYQPAVSPDGQRIACLVNEHTGAPAKIAIFSVDGGAPLKMLDLPVTAGVKLVWSSDGKSILHVRIDGGVSNIWSAPIDGSPAKKVTNFTEDRIFSFAVSKDGKELACARGSNTSDVVLISGFR